MSEVAEVSIKLHAADPSNVAWEITIYLLTLPGINMVQFFAQDKLRMTLQDACHMLTHMRQHRCSSSPKALYISDMYEEMYNSGAKCSLTTALPSTMHNQMMTVVEFARTVNVMLTASPSASPSNL